MSDVPARKISALIPVSGTVTWRPGPKPGDYPPVHPAWQAIDACVSTALARSFDDLLGDA